MPTDADRAAFAEAKDICAERGWELHGWWHDERFGWQKYAHHLDEDGIPLGDVIVGPETTRPEHIDATIAVMARGLNDRGWSVTSTADRGVWTLFPTSFGTRSKHAVMLNADSELAAHVAACKEVGK